MKILSLFEFWEQKVDLIQIFIQQESSDDKKQPMKKHKQPV